MKLNKLIDILHSIALMFLSVAVGCYLCDRTLVAIYNLGCGILIELSAVSYTLRMCFHFRRTMYVMFLIREERKLIDILDDHLPLSVKIMSTDDDRFKVYRVRANFLVQLTIARMIGRTMETAVVCTDPWTNRHEKFVANVYDARHTDG